MTRADLADHPIGYQTTVDGVLMRHLGGGRFVPAMVGEPLVKRFDMNEGEQLHRWVA